MAAHFGTIHKKINNEVYNWFMGLVRRYAVVLGRIDQYEDLFALPYVIDPLSTFANFLGEVIVVWGDPFWKERARKSLESCYQNNTSITDYNSRFLSLVFNVSSTDSFL